MRAQTPDRPQVGDSGATVQTRSGPAVSSDGVGSDAGAGNVSAPLQFVPVTPCRVVDTRLPNGPFGGPGIAGGYSRQFDIPQSACNIPASAVAYSLNVTVVPNAELHYITVWPSGQPLPTASTLNSLDGRIKANAAIVPAGVDGGVNVFAYDATQVILDIDGYFVPAGTVVPEGSLLEFYPVTPCRLVDTRNADGPLGGPSITGGDSRSFPLLSGTCGLPSTALAYSLNVTAVPHTILHYLTSWPTGQPLPVASTLNALTGTDTANAAIVPAGTGGAVSIFVYDDADVVLDVNGYFAPPGANGLSLYTETPCRPLDTRLANGAFSGLLPVTIETGPCPSPAAAQAYVLNATVVPSGSLPYITLWPNGETEPVVSTLNAVDGAITSNMAIVPTNNGSIDAFAYSSTQLILDTSGYFAQATVNPLPNGTYAFMFAGTGPQGSPSAQNGIALDGEFTVAGGAVTAGFYDENTNSGPPVAEQAITGGSISAGANGIGKLVLTSASGSATYTIAVPQSAGTGSDSAIRIIRFDDTNGTGVRGSGVVKPSSPAAASAIQGRYVFLLSGSSPQQVQEALVVSFATDGAGNIPSGTGDANQGGGQMVNFSSVTGGYSIDANGRGLYHLMLDGHTFNYSFYEVSPTEWLSISIDPVTPNGPLVSGSVLQQFAGPFTSASLPAISVMQANGLQPGATAGASVPDMALGTVRNNGGGSLTWLFDQYDGTFIPQGTFTATYAIDPASGRAATSPLGENPILYVIGNGTSAFTLFEGQSAKSGILESQSGTPFSNASLNGNFLGGSVPVANTSVLNEAGAVTLDGNGNVTFTTDRSTPAGLVTNQSVTGTYAVDSTGRAVVTTPDGDTRIFYVVSPRKIGYLTSDTAGYLGSFTQ